MDKTKLPTSCPNCTHETDGPFCSSCGQQVNVDPRLVRYWIRTFFDEVFSLDGRVPKTLKVLIFRPGFLTREWEEGRRSRWPMPFRLYLLTSLIFFTAGLMSPVQFRSHNFAGPGAAVFQAISDSEMRVIWRTAPQLIILLVPLFALFLRYVFDRRKYYVEHLIHAFHIHAFSFLALSSWYMLGPLPYPWQMVFLPFLLWIPVYIVVSSRRVYGSKVFGSILKSTIVLIVHGFVLWVAFQVVAKVGQQDPRDMVKHVNEKYWQVRDASETGELIRSGASRIPGNIVAGFLIVEYERLEEHLHTPFVRAHMADLLLRDGRPKEARLTAEEALVTDPDHLLCLGLAARAAEADSLPEFASGYHKRFMAAYPSQADKFKDRYRLDVEAFRKEAEAIDAEQVPSQGDSSTIKR